MPAEHDTDSGAPQTEPRVIPPAVKFCFVFWICVVLGVYFLAFGSRFIVSLLGRIGLGSAGEALQRIHDGLMTWFSAPGA